jgi:hypothetical protein
VAWWVPYLDGLTLATRGAEPKGALGCRGRRGGGGNPSDVRFAWFGKKDFGEEMVKGLKFLSFKV